MVLQHSQAEYVRGDRNRAVSCITVTGTKEEKENRRRILFQEVKGLLCKIL